MAHIMIVTFHRGFPVNYARHVDHRRHTVSYVTDMSGLEFVLPYQGTDLIALADAGDVDGVLRAAGRLVLEAGRPDVVCAPSEWDLDTAAVIRERFGVAGPTVAQAARFQDKVLMKRALRARGLATPDFVGCDSYLSVRDLLDRVGFPLVLKPRRGAASRGVHVVRDMAELSAIWPQLDHRRYECEQFVDGPIYHVDGVVADSGLRVAIGSRYVNTCLQSAHGLPHGSVVVDDPELQRRLVTFAAHSLDAMGMTRSAFHMEIIMRDGTEPVFLEVGARPGGGEVQQLLEDVYGVDLLREWIDVQLGADGSPAERRESAGGPVGGWLVVPAPARTPYEIITATPMTGIVPHLYHEHVPTPGDVHDADVLRRERWPGGRFRYAGPSTADVEKAISQTIAHYRVVAGSATDGGTPRPARFTARPAW